MHSSDWYYSQNNTQQGPVSAFELKRLAESGKLRPEDLVWQDGMKHWIPASQVKGLFPGSATLPLLGTGVASVPPIEDSVPAFERSAAVFARTREGGSRHLFDRLLDAVRVRFPANAVDSTWRLFGLIGHYALYAAMGMSLAVGLILARAERNYLWLLGAVGMIVLLAVLQYAARRFIVALDRLTRAVPCQLSSSAFLDCYALFYMILGLVVMLVLAVVAVHANNYVFILPGMAAFIFCQYAALLALTPEMLSLSIASDTGPGEEALGILAFLVKSATRLVPVAFGVGVIWGTIYLIRASVMVFYPSRSLGALEHTTSSEQLRHLPAEVWAYDGAITIVAFALLPLVMYLVFLFSHLLIDLLRALLALPAKLERLIEKNHY